MSKAKTYAHKSREGCGVYFVFSTLSCKFWSASYTTVFKKECATRQVWKVTFLMTLLISIQILVRCLQARFQPTADVIIVLAIRSDTIFSLGLYYFSPLFLVKLFFSEYLKLSSLYYCLFVPTQGKRFYKIIIPTNCDDYPAKLSYRNAANTVKHLSWNNGLLLWYQFSLYADYQKSRGTDLTISVAFASFLLCCINLL